MNEEFEQITIQLNRMIESLDEHIKKEFMAVISQKNAQYQACLLYTSHYFCQKDIQRFLHIRIIHSFGKGRAIRMKIKFIYKIQL